MKTSATSRADLLRCMGQGLSLDVAALALGYVRVREDQPAPLPEMPLDLSETRAVAPPVEESPVPDIQFPTERPRLTFLMPVRVESLAPPQPRKDRGNPISDAALAVDWSHQGPPLPPLTRWSRLAPFLRQRLGTVIPGTALDQRRLMREVGKGLPLVDLPRRPRPAWAAQAVVLWDGTAEMYPFQRDVQDLLQHLRRERGAHGLEVRLLRRLPRRSDAARIPLGVPVIALSAMGQFQQSEVAQEAWMALARRLGFLGQAFHALNPCPRDRWQPQLAALWPSGVWDRRPRLPRRGGLRALRAEGFPTDSENPERAFSGQNGSTQNSIGGFSVPQDSRRQSAGVVSSVERLLTVLSPASRIEAPLLRTARLALGRAADAGTEWDAWHHEQCWHSLDCFGFHPGADYEARLNRRQALTGREAVLADQIGGLMAAHHAGCSRVIAAEAELRAILSGRSETQKGSSRFREARRLASEESAGLPESAGSDSPLGAVKTLLQSVVDRLRLLAADPGGEEGRQSGLPIWFPGMVERLSESMRADAEVKKLIAEGLAYAHAFLETAHVELPSGVDGEVYREAVSRIPGIQSLGQIHRLLLHSEGIDLVPNASRQRPREWLGIQIRHTKGLFQWSVAGECMRMLRLPDPNATLRLRTQAGPPKNAVLATDYERIHFEARVRPWWAKRLFWGPDGALHAEADLDGKLVTLLWSAPEVCWPVLDEDFWDGPEVENWRWECQEPLLWSPETEVDIWADEYGLAAEFRIIDVPFTLRWIPPGSFLMGSPEDEPGRQENEGPQHRVTISKGYWMAETPVTQAQWRAVVEATGVRSNRGLVSKLNPAPSYFKGPPNLPVESVSWADSTAFCRLLNSLLPDGPGFHLPTEAQWEYACRAGEPKVPFHGPIRLEGDVLSPDLEDYAWYGGNSGKDCVVSNPQNISYWLGSTMAGTHPVKTKQPNGIGLHDILGNVWEWCSDEWDEVAYSKRADGAKDPYTDSTDDSAEHVARGGSWFPLALDCRAAFRSRGRPGDRSITLGLRLAAGQEPWMAKPTDMQRRQDTHGFMNFSPRAHQVLALARKESERLETDYVGVEHLMLGMIKLEKGSGWRVLQSAVDLEVIRTKLEEFCVPAKKKITGNMPYTPRLKTVLAFSKGEAEALGSSYLGTEHMLLGLLRDEQGPATQVLKALGMSLESCRDAIISGPYDLPEDEDRVRE